MPLNSGLIIITDTANYEIQIPFNALHRLIKP
jgi:hypothetical protein